jgi:hypothetical protein
MECKAIPFRAAGAALFLFARTAAALAGSPHAPLEHKACDKTTPGHPCWVEPFAVAVPNKVVVAHVHFDRQQDGKTLTVRYTIANAKTADIPIRLEGLTKALKSLSG